MQTVRTIASEADYDRALTEVAAYFENQPATGTEAAERFNILSDLIAAYEAKHWPLETNAPLD